MSIADFTMISIDQLELAEFNVNEMDDEQLNLLVQKIEEDGFDEPLQVCPIPETTPQKYRVIGGNHRLRACRILEIEEVPCSVKDWSDVKQKTEIVSRNLLKGDINKKKFNDLVRDIEATSELTLKEISKNMSFADEGEFLRYYKDEKEKHEELVEAAAVQGVKEEVKAVEDLTFLLNKIFAEFGDTVPQGFMFFMYKGQMHLLTRMDSDLKNQVEEMCKRLRNDESSINDYLKRAFAATEVTPPTA